MELMKIGKYTRKDDMENYNNNNLTDDFVLSVISGVPGINVLYEYLKQEHNNHWQRHWMSIIEGYFEGTNEREMNECFIKRIEDNDKFRKMLVDVIIVEINNNIQIEKTYIVGKILSAFVRNKAGDDEKWSYDLLCEIVELNRALNKADYILLNNAIENGGLTTTEIERYKLDKLKSLGLVYDERDQLFDLDVEANAIIPKDFQKGKRFIIPTALAETLIKLTK